MAVSRRTKCSRVKGILPPRREAFNPTGLNRHLFENVSDNRRQILPLRSTKMRARGDEHGGRCPFLALFGRERSSRRCRLIAVERTFRLRAQKSQTDPGCVKTCLSQAHAE